MTFCDALASALLPINLIGILKLKPPSIFFPNPQRLKRKSDKNLQHTFHSKFLIRIPDRVGRIWKHTDPISPVTLITPFIDGSAKT